MRKYALLLAVAAFPCWVWAADTTQPTTVAAPSIKMVKVPVPSEGAARAARQRLDKVYGNLIVTQQPAEVELAYAQKMLDAAKEEKDDATRYVLLVIAQTRAETNGDFELATSAVMQMNESFKIDALSMLHDTVLATSKYARALAKEGKWPAQTPSVAGGGEQTAPSAVEKPAPPAVEKPAPPAIAKATPPARTTANAAKTAPPTTAATEGAVKLFQEVYKDDLAVARSPESKGALAQKFLDLSKQESDDTNRYVLLCKARDLGVESGNFNVASQSIAEMNAFFSIDSLSMLKDAVFATSKTAFTPQQRKDMVLGAINSARLALDADRFDIAPRIADVAVNIAKLTDDSVLNRQAEATARDIREAEEAYGQIKADLATLASKPDDPAANLKVGRYRCFFKGDWERGLPLLAAGSDEQIKAAAEKELAGPTNANQEMELADFWYDQSNKLTGPAKDRIQAHAASYYSYALPGLSGLLQAKVEKRLKEIGEHQNTLREIQIDPALMTMTLRRGRPGPGADDAAAHLSGDDRARIQQLAMKWHGMGTDEINLMAHINNDGQPLYVAPDAAVPLGQGGQMTSGLYCQTPVDIRIICKSRGDLRLAFPADQIIFDWEMDHTELRIDGGPAEAHKPGAGSLPENQWNSIELVVLPDQLTIYVNGEERYHAKADLSKVRKQFSIRAQNGQAYVKSVTCVKMGEWANDPTVDKNSFPDPRRRSLRAPFKNE